MTKITQPALNEACVVCCSPQRAALLAQRDLGASLDEIAANSGHNLLTLEEHFSNHVSAAGDDSEKAMTDATELYFASVLAGNMNAAASALSVRARIIAERNRRKASANKTKSAIAGAVPGNESTYSPELADFIRRVLDNIVERATEHEVFA